MTVSTINAEIKLSGNDVATEFPLGFEVAAASDLIVWLADASSKNITPLQLNFHYTVSNLDNEEGATLNYPVMGAPLALGNFLLVQRAESYTQPISLKNQAGFNPDAFEAQFDALTKQVQQLKEQVDRAVKLPISVTANNVSLFDNPTDRFLQFDQNWNPMLRVPFENEAGTVQTLLDAALVAKTEAEVARNEAVAAENSLLTWMQEWQTGIAYTPSDIVRFDGSAYICEIAHTAGTFLTDVAAGRFNLFVAKGATGAGTGDVLAANNGSEFEREAFLVNLGINGLVRARPELVLDEDLDDIKIRGKYPVTTDVIAASLTNGPPSEKKGWLTVDAIDSMTDDLVVQTYEPVETGKVWKRTNVDGTWSNWRELLFEDSLVGNIIAYGQFNGDGGAVIKSSSGVASITRTASGRYTVVFSSPRLVVDYAIVASCGSSNSIGATNIGVNGFDLVIRRNDDNSQIRDDSLINFTVVAQVLPSGSLLGSSDNNIESPLGFNNATPVEMIDMKEGGIKVLPDPARDTPYLNISTVLNENLPKNYLFIQQLTEDRTDSTTVQLQRISATDDGHVNPKALRVLYQVEQGGDVASKPWAVSAELISNTTAVTSGEAGTALSGVSRKILANTGVLFGAHIQAKDETGLATSGGLVGLELNIQANGADTNNNRVGVDLIARTFSGGSAGQMHAGLRIRADTASGGRWNTGLLLEDGINPIPQGVSVKNSPGSGAGWGSKDEGTKNFGFWAAGTYGTAAIAVPENQNIRLGVNALNGIFMRYNSATDKIEFYKGGTLRASIDMGAGGSGTDMN